MRSASFVGRGRALALCLAVSLTAGVAASLHGGIWDAAVELCAGTLGSVFMPHGSCYLWQPGLVGLHVVSDSLIAASYFSIPFALFYYASRRREASFAGLFLLFGSFISLCGMTHLIEVYNVWNAAYWQSGAIKAATAGVSMTTAFVLVRSMPTALKIPLPQEMQRMTAELRAGSRYRLLGEFMFSANWVTDARGLIHRSNPTWSAFTGQTDEAARLLGWVEMFDPDDRQDLLDEWHRRVETSSPFARETRLWSAERREYVPVMAKGVPVKGADGRVLEWVGAVNDLSDVKKQEAELARYAQRLDAKNRALQEFNYAASHDLQEPLRKIQAYGELLERECSEELSEDARSHVGVMRNAAGRMSQLIQDLMDYSQASVKRMNFAPVDLRAALEEAIANCEVSAEEAGASFELGDLPTVESDGSLVRAVFQNVVSNALKYRKPGVSPRIEASATLRRASELELFSADLFADRYWEVTIADNGIGFAPRFAETIFKPFQRLHGPGEYSGTGIGLAICAQAMQRVGGWIRAESEEGEGARFLVYFPAS